MTINISRLHSDLEIPQVCHCRSIKASYHIILVIWCYYSGQNPNDCDDDHQLYKGKTPGGEPSFFHKGLPTVIK